MFVIQNEKLEIGCEFLVLGVTSNDPSPRVESTVDLVIHVWLWRTSEGSITYEIPVGIFAQTQYAGTCV